MVGVTDVVVFQPLVERLLEAPDGPVGQYLTEKADTIELLAQSNAQGAIIGERTGDLFGGIAKDVFLGADGLVAVVGTDAEHGGFNYPAWHDQNGRPWLTTALRDAFAG